MKRINIRIFISEIKCRQLKSLTYILNANHKKKTYANPCYILQIKLGEKMFPLLYSKGNDPYFNFSKEEIIYNKTVEELKQIDLNITIFEYNSSDDISKLIKEINKKVKDKENIVIIDKILNLILFFLFIRGLLTVSQGE